MSGQALGRPENWFWSHCNGSALLHLFHNWGHTTAGKLGRFAQESCGVKSHKRSHSIPYSLPVTERAQTPLKFSFCPRCCETFTTQSVNVRGGLKLLPDLSQDLKANHSFKKKIIFPEQVFWQQDLGGQGETLPCNPLLVLEKEKPLALKTKATLTILWLSVSHRTAAPHGSNDAAHPF